MRKALLPALAGLALAILLPATPAAACSVVPTYRVPTNLELAQRSDMIVVARAVRTQDNHAPGIDDIVFQPVELLKGAAWPGEIRISGDLTDDPRRVVPSDPRELLNPNPGTMTGGCTRYLFRRDMLVVLFLMRGQNGGWHVGFPFSRSAEDVPGLDAPWVRATRFYVQVAAMPERRRRRALIARRDMLRAQVRGDPAAAILAADIDRQLQPQRLPARD